MGWNSPSNTNPTRLALWELAARLTPQQLQNPCTAHPAPSSQRQVASSLPASASLTSTVSPPKFAVHTVVMTVGIHPTVSHPLFHPQAPDKIFPDPPSLLPLASLPPYAEQRLQHLRVLQPILLPGCLNTAIQVHGSRSPDTIKAHRGLFSPSVASSAYNIIIT